MIRGWEQLSCEDRLRKLQLFSLGKKLGDTPYSSFPESKGSIQENWRGTFYMACGDRARSNAFKLKEGRFRLDIRKKFSAVRVARHWHRLPRAAVAAPSLAVLRVRLDGTSSNPV